MDVLKSTRHSFWGRRPDADIEIDRDRSLPGRTFYIRVTHVSGGMLYDGWAPEDVTTMAQAKAEALRGAGLT